MPTTQSKVNYGIKNVYYAVITEGAGGAITYGTPVRFPGARSLTLQQSGQEVNWPADDVSYFTAYSNSGYTGTLTMARLIDEFAKDVLDEQEDDNGALVEYSDHLGKKFALLFEIEGDAKNTRFCLFNCTVSRPDINANTIGGDEAINPDEQAFNITVSPRVDNALVKAKCSADQTPYDTWFDAVYTPVFA